MLTRLDRFVNALLASKVFKTDEEITLYYVLVVATAFGAVAYFGLLALMMLKSLWGLAILDAFSFAFMLPLYLLITRKQRYRLVGIVFFLFVTATITVHIWMLGTDSYLIFYYVLIVVMQFITPYAGLVARGLVLALQGVCIVGSALVGMQLRRVTEFGLWGTVFTLYNILIVMVGLCVVLFLVSTVQRVVVQYNAMRLQEMTNRANSDALTGLYNRRYAYQFFDMLRSGKVKERWCVAMVDIDNFKHLNDTWGHEAGDIVLTAIARELQSSLRDSDLVIRWGGEEFLLVLQGAGPKQAFVKLDAIRRRVAQDLVCECNGQQLSVTITMGVAALALDDVEGSIRRCDEKLYKGKASGKNKVVI